MPRTDPRCGGRRAVRHARPLPPIQKEELWVGPGITRVGRNKERQIADQAHTHCPGVPLEPCPLTEQEELREPNLFNLSGQVPTGSHQGTQIAPDQLLWPVEITGAVVPGFQGAEK